MAPGLREEIKQKKPFTSIYQEAELSVVRTAAVLGDKFALLFKPFGITSPQYNVLRILRGAEPEGLCRNDLRDRMLTRMPDMSRMIDRMEAAGLVKRERDPGEDRRLVFTRITSAGQKLLKDLEGLVTSEHEKQLGHFSEADLRTLIDLLTRARSNSQ